MFLKNFLVLILIESFLDSWIFNLIILDSWFLKLESWNLILESWNQISLDSWSVLDSILNSFSWAFCHHLCYHKKSLNQSWFIIIMKLASTQSSSLQESLIFKSDFMVLGVEETSSSICNLSFSSKIYPLCWKLLTCNGRLNLLLGISAEHLM